MLIFNKRLFVAVSRAMLIVALISADPGSHAPTRVAAAADDHHHEGHGHDDDHDSDSHDVTEGRHEGPAAGERAHEKGVVLSPAQMQEFGVEVATAGSGRIDSYVVLPGEVLPNADRVAHIVPRYAGIVKEVRKSIGDKVEMGDVLAVIESSETLTGYELKTLLAGTIIAKHVTRGEAVTRDSQAFVIADLSEVWIELSIYQRDLDRVRVDQRVLVSSGHDSPDLSAVVSYVSPVVDEDTRTARARLVMDNGNGAWRPGMFVTGRVAVNEVLVPVAVSHSALQSVENAAVVFVQGDEGFEARKVEIGRTSTTHAEILAGLSPGDRYVAKGGFIIKAELGKAELGHGHSH